ncbi:hypothetical protein [Erwinia phage Gungnir39]|nr:hypothetical protein [Erwinia phage Gungnir39]
MNELFLSGFSPEDIDFEGYFDGQQKIIPDNTEVSIVVTDAFNGIVEGKATQEFQVFVAIIGEGEFTGQKYKYNAKVYDMDAAKRDRAMKNIQLLDVQAGSPLTKGKMPLTTENMQEYWVGKAFAKAKIGLTIMDNEDGTKREINFIRGFGFLRERIPAEVQGQQAAVHGQQAGNQAAAAPAQSGVDDDVGF